MNYQAMTLVLALCVTTAGGLMPSVAVAAPASSASQNDPDAFDPYRPGAYLGGKTFHVPAGASFAWQAWESPKQRVGAILVNDLLEQSLVKIEHIELAHPDDDPESLVLNQYTLTINPDVPADSILNIKTGGGTESTNDPNWSFGFVMHIVAADKYQTLLPKPHLT